MKSMNIVVDSFAIWWKHLHFISQHFAKCQKHSLRGGTSFARKFLRIVPGVAGTRHRVSE